MDQFASIIFLNGILEKYGIFLFSEIHLEVRVYLTRLKGTGSSNVYVVWTFQEVVFKRFIFISALITRLRFY